MASGMRIERGGARCKNARRIHDFGPALAGPWEAKALRSNESTAHPWMANSLAEIKQAMLKEIGAASIEELFEQIPVGHRLKTPLKLPRQLKSELELRRHLIRTLSRNGD